MHHHHHHHRHEPNRILTRLPDTAAPKLPVSVEECLAQSNLTCPDDADLIRSYILSACDVYERETGRLLRLGSYRLKTDHFPPGQTLRLPGVPLVSVESVTYYSDPTTQVTLSEDTDFITAAPDGWYGYIAPVLGYWPATYCRPLAVTVEFTAGGVVSDNARHFLRLCVAHWYESREGEGTQKTYPIGFGLDRLLDLERVGGVW